MADSETLRARHNRRKLSLKTMRQPYEGQWGELADFIAPSRLRLLVAGPRGQKKRTKIVDTTGTFALRTLASGMHSGITSPARPWFVLSTNDPQLKDYGPVKEYLAATATAMRDVFSSSNLYTAFHYGYGDLGLFGQSCGILVQDRDTTIRMMQLLHGTFWLARDHNGRAVTCYREFQWTVEQIVGRFPLANCSQNIKNAYDKGDLDQKFTINHAIEKRHNRVAGKVDKPNMEYASNYWEEGASVNGPNQGMLEVSGFSGNPIVAPPWELMAEDHYAESPGMDVLPDVKSLQILKTRKAEAIDKKVRPPMKGPTSMKNNPASLLPGSITYVDDPTGKGYSAAIEVNLSIAELVDDIRDGRDSVNRGLYADLFMMLANMEGIQPRNQFEIAERKEEKLLALGPVLENIYGGQLAPVIDRTFAIMHEMGKLPKAPPELEGKPLKIEYVSILAQAQKAISTGSIERYAAFIGNHAAIKPDILDKYDADEAADIYGDLLGVPPSLIVPDEKVKAIREGRAAAQAKATQTEQMAQMAPVMKQGAEAAALMAETDTGNPASLLSKIGLV